MRGILRRIVQLVVVLIVVTFFVAVLLEFLPGDPVTTIAPFAHEEQRDQHHGKSSGLDEPLRSGTSSGSATSCTGDLGNYYRGPQVDRPRVPTTPGTASASRCSS